MKLSRYTRRKATKNAKILFSDPLNSPQLRLSQLAPRRKAAGTMVIGKSGTC